MHLILNDAMQRLTFHICGVQVSLSLAEAVVTALVTASNYTVTVGNTSVNATQVVNVYLAGLQDALTPCAKNVSSSSNDTTSGAYFTTIAQVPFLAPTIVSSLAVKARCRHALEHAHCLSISSECKM